MAWARSARPPAHAVVGEQPAAVGDRPVAHPLDQGRLDLDHVHPLHPAVAEDPLQGEAESQPADQHPPRCLDHRERGVRECLLGGVLGGVHHEHAVRAEFQYGRTAGRVLRARTTLAQHELAPVGVAACHLVVLHGSTVGTRGPARRGTWYDDLKSSRTVDNDDRGAASSEEGPMQDERPTPRVVVIGAGAAGSLTALHLARPPADAAVPSTSSWSTARCTARVAPPSGPPTLSTC